MCISLKFPLAAIRSSTGGRLLVCVISLVGCGGERTATEPKTVGPDTRTESTIGPAGTDSVWIAKKGGARLILGTADPSVRATLAVTDASDIPDYYLRVGDPLILTIENVSTSSNAAGLASDASPVARTTLEGRRSPAASGTMTTAASGTITARVDITGKANPAPGYSWAIRVQVYESGSTSPLLSFTSPGEVVNLGTSFALQYTFPAPIPPRGVTYAFKYQAVQIALECGGNLSLTARDNQPIGNRKALLLIHGIQLDKTDCAAFSGYDPASDTFRALLASMEGDANIAANYKIFVLKYPTYAGVANAGTYLRNELNNRLLQQQLTASTRLVLVAHSMGGLVARHFMRNQQQFSVDRLVTLSTPHQGSPIALKRRAELTAPDVLSGCYTQQYQARLNQSSTRGILPPNMVALVSLFLDDASQGVEDLRPGSALQSSLGTIPSNTVVLGGDLATSDIAGHGKTERSILVLFGCSLDGVNAGRHDSTVPLTSSMPSSLAGNPLARSFAADHLDMSGDGMTPGAPLAVRLRAILLSGVPVGAVPLDGDDQTGFAGTTLPVALKVRIRDANGAALAGATVRWTVAAGTASPAASVTNADGEATTRWTLGTTAGVSTATATAGSATARFNATVLGLPTLRGQVLLHEYVQTSTPNPPNGNAASTGIWILDLSTLQRRRIIQTTSNCLHADPRWSPDGQRVLFACLDQDVWFANSTGTGQTRIRSAGIYTSAGWRASGTTISHALDELRLDGTLVQRIATPTSGGRTLRTIFTERHPSSNGMVVIEGGSATTWGVFLGTINSSSYQLLTAPRYSCCVRWSPDGSKFSVVTDDHISIFNAIGALTGTIPVGVTPQYPVWSPDGSWILYVVGRDLRVASAAGGGPSYVVWSAPAGNYLGGIDWRQ